MWKLSDVGFEVIRIAFPLLKRAQLLSLSNFYKTKNCNDKIQQNTATP